MTAAVDTTTELQSRITNLEAELAEAQKTIGQLYVRLEHKKKLKAESMRKYRAGEPRLALTKLPSTAQRIRELMLGQEGMCKALDICTAMGVSRKVAGNYLRELRRSGHIEKFCKVFKLTEKGRETCL